METLTIQAMARELRGRETDALRAQGTVPAIMYGFGVEPTVLSVDRNALEKAYSQAGESTVLVLDLNGDKHNVLIQDLQRDPLTDFLTHADFRRVDMSKKVEAMVSVEVTGIAPAVKDLGGTLIQSIEEIEVRALPSDLPREFVIDVSSLKTFDDVIHVSDLTVSSGVEVLNDASDVIVTVSPPRDQAELDALSAPVEVDVNAVEVLKAKPAEEETKK